MQKRFYEGREKIIKGFKDGIFLLYYDGAFEERIKFKEKKKNIKNKNGLIDYKKFGRLTDLKEETSVMSQLESTFQSKIWEHCLKK